ncbi:MAG: hypothetical protein OSB09_05250 [Planctomycetota bacterium]|nr:hypothetical protein [Planctomycetota bacterium]
MPAAEDSVPENKDSTDPHGGRPLLKLAGCLGVLLVAAMVGGLISMWMVLSGGLQDDPLILPPLNRSPESLEEISAGPSADGSYSFTLDQWNLILAGEIDPLVQSNQLRSGSGVRLISQPDGRIRLLVTIGFPEDQQQVSWWLRGNYINIEMIGTIVIHDGVIEDAKLDLYQWGSIYKGIDLTKAQSIQSLEQAIQDLKKYPWISIPIRHLEFDGDQLQITTGE